MLSRTFVMSAETSPELRPKAFASTLISRFRSRRLIWFGPVEGKTSATCERRTTRGDPSLPGATLIGMRCRSKML